MSLDSDFTPPTGFNVRIASLSQTHAGMARGYEARADATSLIVFRARQRRTRQRWHLLIIPVVVLAGFKLGVLMQIGDPSYQARIDALASGAAAERMGAWVMQAEPVLRSMAAHLTSALHGG